jgi:hypothetical protein
MRRLLASTALTALLATAAMPASAQVKISGLSQEPGTTIPLADMFAAQSTNCPNFGDCKVSMQQILATVLANSSGAQGATNANPQPFHADYALFTSQIGNTTGAQVYADAIGNCGAGCTNADALRGVATAPPGSTTANVNSVAGYLLNNNANANNGGNGVALFGVAISAVDGAQSWGINVNTEDSATPFTVSNGSNRVLINELDFNVTSPSTLVNGLILQGASVSKPALANGFVLGNLSIGYETTGQGQSVPWAAGFLTEDDAAVYGVQLGLAKGVCVNGSCPANLDSQFLGLAATDASGQKFYSYMVNTPVGMGFSSTVIPMADSAASFGSPTNNWLELWTNRITLKPMTVSALHSCSFTYLGQLAFVTDSQSTQIETNLQGGGNYHVPVFCDGAEWVVL